MMAVDLTIPLGWIKGPECKIEGSSQHCSRVTETLVEKVKETKKKISNKLHKKQDQPKEDAIIEGASTVIRG
jgi:hypothetical protein